jgi:hypothetical protein
MSNDVVDLDELMDEKFLESLDDNAECEILEKPSWVIDDDSHTTYKSWQAILTLKEEKESRIKSYGKVANAKTSSSLFKISKSDVSKIVHVSAQSIFRTSKFSPLVLCFFDNINDTLLDVYKKEQIKQGKRQKNSGIRVNKKEVIVKCHQDIKKELNQLKAKTTKEVLDLTINKMPLDFRLKLGL